MPRKKKRTFVQYLKLKRKKRNTKGILKIIKEAKKNVKVKEIKKLIKEIGGYLTIIKTSNEFDYEEKIFTVDDTRLLISEKIKKSFDPKRIFNPGKMYRGI